MKRILFLSENYLPSISGVPIVVQYLAEGLSQRGYHVTICTKLHEGLRKNEIINDVNIYRFNLKKTLLKRYVGEIEDYRKFVISFNADIIIFECSECATTDVLLKDLPNIRAKKIFHSHGFSGLILSPFKWNVNLKYFLGHMYNWIRFRYYYNFTFKKYIKYFDATICLSEVDSSKKWLSRHAKNVTILSNAIDDIFCTPTRDINYNPIAQIKKPYFFSVATYSKQKNQIGIIKEFFRSQIDYALVFIGPEKTEYYELLNKEIEKLKKKYGNRDIYTFLKIPRQLIPNILGNAFAYLTGSTFEEYSVSLIEAMGKGIPFISTNVGNARILPGGITVSTLKEMHTKMQLLVEDKKLYSKLSACGKLFVQNHCRKSDIISSFEKIINNC